MSALLSLADTAEPIKNWRTTSRFADLKDISSNLAPRQRVIELKTPLVSALLSSKPPSSGVEPASSWNKSAYIGDRRTLCVRQRDGVVTKKNGAHAVAVELQPEPERIAQAHI
jgi:hypothetical protein